MKRAAAFILSFVAAHTSHAFSPYYYNGTLVKWDLNYAGYSSNVFNSATKSIRYQLGTNAYSAANATAELNAIRAAFAQWQAVPGTAVKFEDAGYATGNLETWADGRNVVYFSKTNFVNGGRVSMTGRAAYTVYRTDAQLRIVEADTALNALGFSWFTDINNTTAAAFFVEAIALHEIGHMLGLDHSPLGGAAVINGGQGIGPSLGLSADDIAAARFLYPSATIGSQLGKITGTVRMNGSPVNGAMVTVETSTGTAIMAATSDPAGKYLLPSLPPGSYNVHVSPLDPASASTSLSLMRSDDIPLDVAAITVFKPSENIAVTVNSNATSAQDFSVVAGDPPLRVQQLSKPSSFAAAPQPARYAVGIYPGQTLYTGVASTSLTADAVFSITGDGLTIGPMIFEANRFGAGVHLLQAAVTVATNATPGLRTFVVRRGSDLAYANGYFEVHTTTPDDNFDGLDDRFQRLNFPLFTAPEAAPAADPDNDHFSNAFEAATGTNPNNPQSHSFLIDRVVVTQTGAQVSWTSDPGKQYELYSKTDVAGAGWQFVAATTATGPSTQLTDPGATGNKFYRLKLLD